LIFLAALSFRYDWNPSALIGLGAEDPLNAPGRLPSGLIVFEGRGYDGQYFYHIGLDLIRRAHPEVPPVRYQRIGYPSLAALLSFGRESMLPISMIVVNLLAVMGGTWVFTKLLRGYGLSPWYSLLLTFNPGQILGLQMDLAFPLHLALAMGALLFWEKRRLWAATIFLAASILTSESAVLFLAPVVAAELFQRRWRGAAVLSLAALPFLAYQGLLWVWMGAGGIITSAEHIVIPGAGMVPVLANAQMSLGQGFLAMVRQASIIAVMAIMVSALALSIWKLSKGYNVYSGGVFCHAAFSLFASYVIWEAYASAGRVFSGLFPLLVLSYGARRERWSPILFGATAVLGFLTLLRPFLVSPRVPFLLTP
jgi:hypothetical protein